MLESDDFDLYVTHLLWMRFVEYVPARFVSSQSRAQVLNWIRLQLHRPELSEDETIRELNWHVERIQGRWLASSGEMPF